MPKLTVVIPTLDEEGALDGCLDSIATQRGPDIVVSDGGSSHETVARALARGATVVEWPAGRGWQLNRGAAATDSALLLFLHADCRLPDGWYDLLASALADPSVSLSCFRLRTESADDRVPSAPARLWLRTLDLRVRGGRVPYGDQGFGIRREVFDAVGGFPDIPLMEDLVVARACRKIGRIRRLPLTVRTSSRRIDAYPLRARLMMLTFPTLFGLGVSPETLARWYGNAR